MGAYGVATLMMIFDELTVRADQTHLELDAVTDIHSSAVTLLAQLLRCCRRQIIIDTISTRLARRLADVDGCTPH